MQWLEFGVAGGATTTWMAKYREAVCGSYPGGSTNVVGFDTFTVSRSPHACRIRPCTAK